MSRRWLLGLAALALIALAAPAYAFKIEPVESAGGVKAWLVEDHSLKIVSIRVAFAGGSALDPNGKEGLAMLVSGLLDEGAGPLDSGAFHAKLEDLTASFDAEADANDFTVASRVQSANFDTTIDLLHLALAQPHFDAAAVARIKNDILSDIAEAQEEPAQRADRIWRRVAFGDHSYGRSWFGTPTTLERIEIDDLHKFAHDRFTKDDALIAVVGDITPDQLKPELDRLFAGLAEHGTSDAVPNITVNTKSEIMLSRLPVPQSVAMFGEAGIKRDDPDWYAAALVMHVLGGGGFDTRLTEEVRVKRGLAYSVDFEPDPMQHAPLLLGEVASRNAKIGEAMAIIRGEVRRMRDEGPTEQELQSAKTYLTGSFPLGLDSTQRIAGLLITIQRDHLGLDYLDRRTGLFEAVTLGQAKRVAKRILDPDKLLFVVVGDPESLPGALPAPVVE